MLDEIELFKDEIKAKQEYKDVLIEMIEGEEKDYLDRWMI